MFVLSQLTPKDVFTYFEQISAIPRASGNTAAVSDYCVAFAKAHGLAFRQDEWHNVVIYKPASKGKETAPTTVLQGHLDMVAQKDPESTHDFTKDGLALQVRGDMLSADGTTLGADNGIAVAMILAILADDTLPHPPLEAVFTADEETGMDGAIGLNPEWITGRRFLNLDSEEEGVLTVGCAGGARAELCLPVARIEGGPPTYEVTVSGLTGGHSGAEIHTGRENANHVLAQYLYSLPFEFQIVSLTGGEKDNVITKESHAVLVTNGNLQAAADFFLAHYAYNRAADPHLNITVKKVFDCSEGLTLTDTRKVVRFLQELPYGVQAMSEEFKDLPKTSLNFGMLMLEKECLHATFSVRSAVAAEKEELLHTLSNICEKYGGTFSTHGHYPAWEYRKDSPLRETVAQVYRTLFGKEPKIAATHGGLECGLFCEKLSGLDAVSFGPDMWDIHTPSERLSIASVARTYQLLTAVLAEIREG